MNREQARTLIRQTFTQGFDKGRFGAFAVNLLNHIDESKAASWGGQYIKQAFKDHVHRYERLGTYTTPDRRKLDVLIVHLAGESKLERARTSIRNFVADHLKTRDEKDAALVAFVSPSETTWRFSYVKMEYATVEKEGGKVGVESHLTPARRFSYLVGEGESCHTAQTRFLNLLQDTETAPALAGIEEAFSVEAVTKEFFLKYAELFERIHKALKKLVAQDRAIHDEFKAKGVKIEDFAKKLMGQIVFLYFLQKKGWLGVAKGKDWGSGPRDFLRRLAGREYGSCDNFFNDVLEPLFYDTLATDRGHEAWCNRFKCRIPFLNGGLFEPLGDYNWKKTDIILPNDLFTNSDPIEEGVTGTGVFDVFDRYNFTVNEAEPLETEVAIDPEMLGKVFENLIEENRRKGLGAFYTPREIVHYMCQESLVNYLDTALNTSEESIAGAKPTQAKLFGAPEPIQASLKVVKRQEVVPRTDIETLVHLGEQISHYEAVEARYAIRMPKSIEKHARLIDDKLAEIAVCDPAVGSGAFPVGMMHEIVRARGALTPYFKGDTDIPVCDPEAVRKTRRNLPHWTKDGSIYWITFRLADSLPQEKLIAWRAEREIWLTHHPEPWNDEAWKEYDERFGKRLQAWLDAGHGSCALARPDIRQVVQDCLLRFDGERLRLHAGVVMPNHVHLLLEPLAGQSLSELLKGIKGASARMANRILGNTGTRFWMDESYDHIVRSQAQYEHFCRYIADNPVKARLSPENYWLYRSECEGDTGILACAPRSESNSGILACAPQVAQTRMSVPPRSSYHFKRHAIQNCLYGVDIDAGAVEIAKLRLWLSLVVDEEDVKQIKPLPNLDYKIVVGDSLLGFPFKTERLLKIEEQKAAFFAETDHDKKRHLKRAIDAELAQAFANSKKTVGYEVTFDFEIFFSEVFHAKKGFDIVIANPPYVSVEEFARTSMQAEWKRRFKTYASRCDIYCFFYEKGLALLRDGGGLTFISSNKFQRAGYGVNLRRLLSSQRIEALIDFCELPVFAAATDPMIVMVAKAAPGASAEFPVLVVKDEAEFGSLRQSLSSRASRYKPDQLKVDGWSLEGGQGLALVEKLRAKGAPLGDYVHGKFYYGIKTGLNEAFVIDRATRDRLIREDRKSAELIKPWIRGKDIKRWRHEFHDLYVIVVRYGFHKELTKYPAILRHLSDFERQLKARGQCKTSRNGAGEGQHHWLELDNNPSPEFLSLFDEDRVVLPIIKKTHGFSFVKGGSCSNDKTTFCLSPESLFLLAVMNSASIEWLVRMEFPGLGDPWSGGRIEYRATKVKTLPIPPAGAADKARLTKLAERAAESAAAGGGAALAQVEREIDEIVYRLFELTPDEIAQIETSLANTRGGSVDDAADEDDE